VFNNSIRVAVDASRNRSGGAVAHLIGLISDGEPEEYGISEVHVWSHQALLDRLPKRHWLIKHNPVLLEKSILHQLFWQFFLFRTEFNKFNCQIVLNTDAGTISRIKPAITMSRDMLSYEPGEMQRYSFGLSRIRLLMLRYIQNSSLKRSAGVIFLTQYAATIIQDSCGILQNIKLVPHGISDHFRCSVTHESNTIQKQNELLLLYISNTDLYKHQWHVVKAAEILYSQGYKIKLLLVGGGSGYAQEKLNNQIDQSDPGGVFVECRSFVPHTELPELHAAADIFIFASSCENMPNTLIEAMAAGLPIASSDRGPMPEVLQDAGLYFDPETPSSIVAAIEKLIKDGALRDRLGRRAQQLSDNYSWRKCADQTWAFVSETYSLEKGQGL
jgi:glycosyltransferase involved in cell wall biosynthesis